MDFSHLISFFWKKRIIILCCSVIPALSLGFWTFFAPRSYQIAMEYHLNLNSVDYLKMRHRFFNHGNIQKITNALEKAGATKIQNSLRKAQSQEEVESFITMDITPSYVDFENKKSLRLSLERSWAENVEKLENLSAKILTLRIKGSPREEVMELADAVQDNLRYSLPLNHVFDLLNGSFVELNSGLGHLEESREQDQFELEEVNKIIQGLKAQSLSSKPLSTSPSISYELGGEKRDRDFLPVPLQIELYQADAERIQAKILTQDHRHLAKQMKVEAVNFLLTEVEKRKLIDYDLTSYLSAVDNLIEQTTDEGLRAFLTAHKRRAQNLSMTMQSVAAASSAVPLAKGTIRLTILTFLLCFCVSTAFLGLSYRLKNLGGP